MLNSSIARGIRGSSLLFFLFLCVGLESPLHAQPTSAAVTIVAKVDGQPIYASEVEEQLARVVRGREVEPQALKMLQAQTIEQLVGRRLILKFLAGKKAAANDKEIDVEIDRIRRRLAVTNVTLEQHLKATGQDEASLRRNLRWQLSWQRYLDRFLAEDNLKKFYGQNRRDFDGTQLQVAHILWKVKPGDAAAMERAEQQAKSVRAQIEAGEVTFAQAAAEHSQSPTAEKGGDLGLISRREPMPESFSHAAFQLQPDEISPPVVSPFGVHLIKCLKEQRGQRGWELVRPEVEQAAMRYLFNWLADRERPKTKVEYTGALPYFKPGTRELAQ